MRARWGDAVWHQERRPFDFRAAVARAALAAWRLDYHTDRPYISIGNTIR